MARKKPAPPAPEQQIETPDQKKARLEREQPHLKQALIRRKNGRPCPTISVRQGEKEVNRIDLDHPDRLIGWVLMANALGTSNDNFTNILLRQLANVFATNGAIDQAALNGALATINGVQPTNEVEGMLAAQMAVVHAATMQAAMHLKGAETIPQLEANSRSLNQLARTFTAQVEALKRYRSKGEQRVTVQHVNVSADQAALQINAGSPPGEGMPQKPKDRAREPDLKRPALADDVSAQMWSPNAIRDAVPMPSSQR